MVWVYSGAKVVAGKDNIIAQEKMMLTDSAGTGVFYLTNGEGTIRVHEGKMGALGFSKGKQIANRHRLIETYKQLLEDDYNRMVEERERQQRELQQEITKNPIVVEVQEHYFERMNVLQQGSLGFPGIGYKARLILENRSQKVFVVADLNDPTPIEQNDFADRRHYYPHISMELNTIFYLASSPYDTKLSLASYEKPWQPGEKRVVDIRFNWYLNSGNVLGKAHFNYSPQQCGMQIPLQLETPNGEKQSQIFKYDISDDFRQFGEKYQ